MSTHTTQQTTTNAADEILELARGAGLLVTLDGQIGREKYQSVAGSLASFMRFVDALRETLVADVPI
jgi:hypothetical protein